MKALALNYNMNQHVSFKTVAGMLNPSNDSSVFQWDFQDNFKHNAMKEIQKAIRKFKKDGTIDC
jgi:hypothetical protein